MAAGFALTDPGIPEQFRAQQTWLSRLLRRILEGKADSLFAVNPFAEETARYVRVGLYDYWFTDTAVHGETGDWWERQPIGIYIPSQELVEGQLQPAR